MTDREVLAYVRDCVGNKKQGVILTYRNGVTAALTAADGDTEEEVVAQLRERWPEVRMVSQKEWDDAFYGRMRLKAKFTTPTRSESSQQEEEEEEEEWIPAVQAAHRLGIPPQYIYSKIYHGKLRTQGERPRRVRWCDVKRMFGPR